MSGGDVGWEWGAQEWDLSMMPPRGRVWQSPQPSPKPVPMGSHLPQCWTPRGGLGAEPVVRMRMVLGVLALQHAAFPRSHSEVALLLLWLFPPFAPGASCSTRLSGAVAEQTLGLLAERSGALRQGSSAPPQPRTRTPALHAHTWGHTITESSRSEKPSKITRSNHRPATNVTH